MVDFHKQKYYQIRANARKSGKDCELSLNDIKKLLPSICIYCGDIAKGLDRLDSSKGYIKSNVKPCCTICNKAKQSLSVKEFMTHIEKIYNYNLE